MTLKPCFLGSSFVKKQTETAFKSDKSDFYLRIGLNQRAVVKIQFICLVSLKGMDCYHIIFKVALYAEGMVTN